MNTQSGHTGSRINPDSRKTLWLTVVLIGSLGLTSFMVSFNGLRDVAAWVGLPLWMRWAVPVFIDIAILAYSLAAVIHKSRGESVKTTWVTLGVFTATSVVANAAHALSVGEGETTIQRSIGAVIAALAPVAVFAATEELSRLAFSYAPGPTVRYVQVEQTPESASGEVENQKKPELASAPEMHSVPVVPDLPVEEESTAENIPGGQNTSDSEKSTSSSAAPDVDEDADLAAWVAEQIRQGNKLTGAAAGEFLGLSARTGRNRLNKLREKSPELFEGEQA